LHSLNGLLQSLARLLLSFPQVPVFLFPSLLKLVTKTGSIIECSLLGSSSLSKLCVEFFLRPLGLLFQATLLNCVRVSKSSLLLCCKLFHMLLLALCSLLQRFHSLLKGARFLFQAILLQGCRLFLFCTELLGSLFGPLSAFVERMQGRFMILLVLILKLQQLF